MTLALEETLRPKPGLLGLQMSDPARRRQVKAPTPCLLRNPEIIGEAPGAIHPLRLPAKAAVLGKAGEFVLRIFVGTLGPDRFILVEVNGD